MDIDNVHPPPPRVVYIHPLNSGPWPDFKWCCSYTVLTDFNWNSGSPASLHIESIISKDLKPDRLWYLHLCASVSYTEH